MVCSLSFMPRCGWLSGWISGEGFRSSRLAACHHKQLRSRGFVIGGEVHSRVIFLVETGVFPALLDSRSLAVECSVWWFPLFATADAVDVQRTMGKDVLDDCVVGIVPTQQHLDTLAAFLVDANSLPRFIANHLCADGSLHRLR